MFISIIMTSPSSSPTMSPPSPTLIDTIKNNRSEIENIVTNSTMFVREKQTVRELSNKFSKEVGGNEKDWIKQNRVPYWPSVSFSVRHCLCFTCCPVLCGVSIATRQSHVVSTLHLVRHHLIRHLPLAHGFSWRQFCRKVHAVHREWWSGPYSISRRTPRKHRLCIAQLLRAWAANHAHRQ